MREAKNRFGCREVERETKLPELLAADLVTRYRNSLTTEEVDKLITLLSAIFGVGSLSAVVDQEQNGPAKVYFAGEPIGFVSQRMEDGSLSYVFSMAIRNKTPNG